jgi:hypothetical protein
MSPYDVSRISPLKVVIASLRADILDHGGKRCSLSMTISWACFQVNLLEALVFFPGSENLPNPGVPFLSF